MQNLQKRLSKQEMISDKFELYFRSDPKTFHADMHFHDFFEFHYVTKGSTIVQIEDFSFAAQPGDLFIYSPKQLHKGTSEDTDIAYERYVLWLNTSYLHALSSPQSNLFQIFDEVGAGCGVSRYGTVERRAIRESFDKLYQAQFDRQFGTDLIQQSYLSELLVTLARLSKQERGDVPPIQKDSLITSVNSYIQEHLSEKISISELANHVFLSRSYFSTRFKAVTGLTIHQFIIKHRLIALRDMVLSGDSLSEAYIKCGFGDYSSFYRAFKSEFGVSPKEYFLTKTCSYTGVYSKNKTGKG